jgi:hypothetical protein
MAGDAMFSKERKTSFLVFVLVSFNSDETNHTESTSIYSERQKYGINSLKIKQNFFQKNLWTGQF